MDLSLWYARREGSRKPPSQERLDLAEDGADRNALPDQTSPAGGPFRMVQGHHFPIVVEARRAARPPFGGGSVVDQPAPIFQAMHPVGAQGDFEGAPLGVLKDVQGGIGLGRLWIEGED